MSKSIVENYYLSGPYVNILDHMIHMYTVCSIQVGQKVLYQNPGHPMHAL